MTSSPPDPGARARDADFRRAILAGNPAGLRAFVDAHLRPLYTFCLHRLGRDHHSAEEVVQETLTLALDRMGEFDPERGDMATWLAYLSRNAIRRANRQTRRFQGTHSVELAALAVGDDPGRDALEDATALVGEVLARLPERHRLVLEQKYVKGEPVRAIAEATATSEKAVESLLVRAREAFRATYVSLANGRTEPASLKTESCS